MSNNENEKDREDPVAETSALIPRQIPTGVDRRKFIMRSAVISAAAVMNGCTRSETEQTAPRQQPKHQRPLRPLSRWPPT